VAKKYPSFTAILGKLVALAAAKYGSAKGVPSTRRTLTELEGLAITPELPDETIEKALRQLVDAGRFAPPPAEPAGPGGAGGPPPGPPARPAAPK
jgi:hypothetical protein